MGETLKRQEKFLKKPDYDHDRRADDMTSSEIMVITMIERDASSARSFFPFSFFVFPLQRLDE